MIAVELPWPPSVNRYWRHNRGVTHISNEGRKYRATVNVQLRAQGVSEPLDGELRMAIKLFPPDRRIRDIDNVLKALLDALQKGGAYHDDSQIKTLFMDYAHSLGGFVEVFVEPRGQTVITRQLVAGSDIVFLQPQAD